MYKLLDVHSITQTNIYIYIYILYDQYEQGMTIYDIYSQKNNYYM